MSEKLAISGWDEHQSYRRDRGQPPWIKLHRKLMRNLEWVSMTDSERGQLVAIWLLAADHDGVIPASPELVGKLCFMSATPNLNKFIDLGFICQHDAVVTPERRQHDETEAEAEAEAETYRKEVETEAEAPLNPPKGEAGATELLKIPKFLDKRGEVEAVEAWNRLADAGGLAKVQKITSARRKKLAARLKDCGGIEGWLAALEKVRGSPGLLGRAGGDWKADFDFLLQESSFTKLMEGKYDGWTGRQGGEPASVIDAGRKALDTLDKRSATGVSY